MSFVKWHYSYHDKIVVISPTPTLKLWKYKNMVRKYAHGSKKQKCIGCSIPSFWPFSCFSALVLIVIWLTPGPEGKIDSQFNRRQIDYRHCSALKQQHTRVQTCLVQLEVIHLGWIITGLCKCKTHVFNIGKVDIT